jgi:pimeloyl-ACP methyl ester carboxylesterase
MGEVRDPSTVVLYLMLGGLSACRNHPSRTARESPTNPADSSYAVAPADTTWPDPARHRAGYASNGGVRIHYLDYGGSGEPLVLLTGLGSSAHIFDDLAPRFTDRFRVIAITRRGHAESDHPSTGYALDTLVADVKAVLDTLRLDRVNLAGHSIAGGELTRFAILHPDRVASLIYLDAMLQPAGLEPLIAEDTIKVKATEADFATYESARAWFQRCFYGFWSPALEADFRINTTPSTTTDIIFKDAARNPAWRQDNSRIHAPALVLYTLATLEQRRPCVAKSPDRDRARRAKAFLDRKYRPHQQAGVELVRRQMPDARIVELKGHHFLFISNQDDVVREMRQFLLNGPARRASGR